MSETMEVQEEDAAYNQVRNEILERAGEAEKWDRTRWNGFIKYGEIIVDGFMEWDERRSGNGAGSSRKILGYGKDVHEDTPGNSILGRALKPLEELGYAEKTSENNNYSRWSLEAPRDELETLKDVVQELEPDDVE